jgi:ribosome-binding protein aMBF1 (putative translation factor)
MDQSHHSDKMLHDSGRVTLLAKARQIKRWSRSHLACQAKVDYDLLHSAEVGEAALDSDIQERITKALGQTGLFDAGGYAI